jgi:uncharacterized protein YqgV (UPF0045/DUF77 family)
MSIISAQVSVYPLRRRSIGEPIERALLALRNHDVEVVAGSMSTVVRGDDSEVFSALHAAFRQVSDDGDAVMVVTVSDACPFDTEARRASPAGGSGRRNTTEAHDV